MTTLPDEALDGPWKLPGERVEALGPCPFCGYEAVFGSISEGQDAGGHFVQCSNGKCGASSALLFPIMDDVTGLLRERWNRRAALAAQPAAEAPAGLDALYKPSDMRDGLEAIRRYGLDTLSGRTDGPADATWYRAAVNEMARRARVALETAPQPAAEARPVRNREADRERFTDPEFNRWLDEGISDAGHTVWDAVGDVQAAWQGWNNRQFYAAPPARPVAQHVGDSHFESWYSTYDPAHKGDKQRARDAYAAGMNDARPVAPAGWLPIETAPKNGTPVLLTNGKTVAHGEWLHQEAYIRERRDLDGRYIDQDEFDGFDGWVDWTGGMLPEPTHWMPLPPPPGASPAAPAPVAPYRAEKIGGSFQHTGTVVAEFRTLAGEERIVLEFDPPVAGMLHVYRPDQVSRIATESQAETAPVAPVALTEEHTFEPISDDEQAALYRHCEGTDHYPVVRRLYRNSCKLPPDLFERERAATICDDLAEMMERGAGECAPGERLRQAARNIREGKPPLSDVGAHGITAPSAAEGGLTIELTGRRQAVRLVQRGVRAPVAS